MLRKQLGADIARKQVASISIVTSGKCSSTFCVPGYSERAQHARRVSKTDTDTVKKKDLLLWYYGNVWCLNEQLSSVRFSYRTARTPMRVLQAYLQSGCVQSPRYTEEDISLPPEVPVDIASLRHEIRRRQINGDCALGLSEITEVCRQK